MSLRPNYRLIDWSVTGNCRERVGPGVVVLGQKKWLIMHKPKWKGWSNGRLRKRQRMRKRMGADDWLTFGKRQAKSQEMHDQKKKKKKKKWLKKERGQWLIEEYYFERLRDSKMGCWREVGGEGMRCVYKLWQWIGMDLFTYDWLHSGFTASWLQPAREGISTYIQNVIRIDALYYSPQLRTKPELCLQFSLFFKYILSCC